MISLITPSNNTTYLWEAYQSIKDQPFDEWVIVPNNGALSSDFSAFRDDKRIRIVPLEVYSENVGSLKRFACSQAKGDVVIEFDHDDLLTPGAIEKVKVAFEDPEVSFVYSNFAEFFTEDRRPNLYNAQWGWKYRPIEFGGHTYQEAIGFPPTPHAISQIYFAPNHLRAWRAKDYWTIGGHDPKLKVADDHDLVCRFYLHGKIRHIDECLYLYRIHGTNTWKRFNGECQTLAAANRDKYLYQLVERWCDLNGYPKIDLGGGFSKPEGYTSVDLTNGDITADLNKRFPFEDSSVGVIRAWDVLEHLKDPVHAMNEIYRVLKPGGWLLSQTPSTDGRGAFQDPTHVSYWNQNSFWYYTWGRLKQYVAPIQARFMKVRLSTGFPSDWHKANDIPYVTADLVALKEGGVRIPGLVEV